MHHSIYCLPQMQKLVKEYLLLRAHKDENTESADEVGNELKDLLVALRTISALHRPTST